MMLDEHRVLGAALRLALAFVLAVPLGWEREHRSRSVGLSTYPLLCVCVCGFVLFARNTAWGPSDQEEAFAGVLGGIGFVGAGAVVKSPDSAVGMSTAVSLWVTGAIGVGVGAGHGTMLLSIALSLMTTLALWVVSLTERRRGTP